MDTWICAGRPGTGNHKLVAKKKHNLSRFGIPAAGTGARRRVALTIAGSDSGGCAGIQADLKTFAALGLHGTSVVTAVTAQNTRRVEAIHCVPGRMVRAQLTTLLADFRVGAIKTGMLGSSAAILAIADVLQATKIPMVVDPVLVSTGGTRLLPERSIALLRRRLLPMATVLTPNIPEAEVLLGRKLRRPADLTHAARDLLEFGPAAVLLKGGHLPGGVLRDVLADARSTVEFPHARLPMRLRGTGCCLSAALAAGLARDMAVIDAVRAAEQFVHRAIRNASRVGRGNRHALDPSGLPP